MFHNYFFLKRLANELQEQLKDFSLLTCFSQNKEELVLGFANHHKEQYLRANLDPNISLLEFPLSYSRANKNSIELFKSIVGKRIIQVKVFRYECSFEMVFESNKFLVFKMHHQRSNIILFENDHPIEVFRNNMTSDKEMTRASLEKPIELNKENFEKAGYDPLCLLPALGKDSKMYLEKNNYYKKDKVEKWRLFHDLLIQLEKNPVSLLAGSSPRISLLESDDEQVDSAICAANWLYLQKSSNYYFQTEKQCLISQLKQKIKRSENYIRKNQEHLTKLLKARNPEEIANIIMTNLHVIDKGKDSVILTDIYQHQPIEITLNKEMSPQKNAEVYYRKSKNRHREVEMLEYNIQLKKNLIENVSEQILQLEDVDNFKDIRKIGKKLKLDKEPSKKTLKNLPYQTYSVEGWQVLVGKNAKSNDRLTLKVAKKNDLWLHAKDVSGSHVVVRSISGQNFSKSIIERAAALAAYMSKRKSDTWCPVIYTLKKFVRKPKSLPAGQVFVEKEEVILVKPEPMK